MNNPNCDGEDDGIKPPKEKQKEKSYVRMYPRRGV